MGVGGAAADEHGWIMLALRRSISRPQTEDVFASAARVAAASVDSKEAARLVVRRVRDPGARVALARDHNQLLVDRLTLVAHRVAAEEAALGSIAVVVVLEEEGDDVAVSESHRAVL